MSNPNYGITIKADGTVLISNILMFYRDGGILIEAANTTVLGCTLIGSAPRWYELKRWWWIIKAIRAYAPPQSQQGGASVTIVGDGLKSGPHDVGVR